MPKSKRRAPVRLVRDPDLEAEDRLRRHTRDLRRRDPIDTPIPLAAAHLAQRLQKPVTEGDTFLRGFTHLAIEDARKIPPRDYPHYIAMDLDAWAHMRKTVLGVLEPMGHVRAVLELVGVARQGGRPPKRKPKAPPVKLTPQQEQFRRFQLRMGRAAEHLRRVVDDEFGEDNRNVPTDDAGAQAAGERILAAAEAIWRAAETGEDKSYLTAVAMTGWTVWHRVRSLLTELDEAFGLYDAPAVLLRAEKERQRQDWLRLMAGAADRFLMQEAQVVELAAVASEAAPTAVRAVPREGHAIPAGEGRAVVGRPSLERSP